MARDHSVSRRTAVKLAGVAASTALVAGCNGGDGNGNGDDGDGNGGGGGVDIEPDQQILFEGVTGGWEGVEPSGIEGETNPTLNLQEGETYEIGWTQGDGAEHNIVLRNDGGDVVEDYTLYGGETETSGDPGDGDFMEFEAVSDIAVYDCNPHPAMEGDINVE